MLLVQGLALNSAAVARETSVVYSVTGLVDEARSGQAAAIYQYRREKLEVI